MSAKIDPLDCLVIGAGPAGLTAAIYLARFRLRVGIVGSGGSRAALISRTRNHAGYPGGISGEDLLDWMQALADTINGLYKAKVIHRRGPWRSLEAVEYATLEWVDWFNNRQLLKPIGNVPPAEAQERYYAMFDEARMAA